VPERHFSKASRLWELIRNENEAWRLRKPRVRLADRKADSSVQVTQEG
jgi:hypothetical protein